MNFLENSFFHCLFLLDVHGLPKISFLSRQVRWRRVFDDGDGVEKLRLVVKIKRFDK